MPRRSDSDPSGSLAKLVTSLPTAEYAISVTVVYDHAQTRKWAGEIFQRLEAVLGSKAVRGTWWNVTGLGEPGVLAGAVSKAMHADMIILAVKSSEGLPLPFYFWVNSWLPHRTLGTGALVALLGEEAPRNRESGRLRKFLRAVAKRARMDLLVAERTADGSARPGAEIQVGSQADS
jgi:hypothetical protein